MNILITLCGRGGSKGIPRKNIKKLNNLPLLSYSIKHAKIFAEVHENVDILLSTDDNEIKDVALKYGLQTNYIRPDYLSNDTVGKIDVLKDALAYQEKEFKKKYDILLDLDITSPLRTQQDLNEGLQKLLSNDKALNLFSVSKPHKNPYFNIVEDKEDGYCKLVCPSEIRSRQTAPQVYDMNASFYFYRRVFFEKKCVSAVTHKSLYYVMNHICFDLDEPLDFDMMEYLLKNIKLGISL